MKRRELCVWWLRILSAWIAMFGLGWVCHPWVLRWFGGGGLYLSLLLVVGITRIHQLNLKRRLLLFLILRSPSLYSTRRADVTTPSTCLTSSPIAWNQTQTCKTKITIVRESRSQRYVIRDRSLPSTRFFRTASRARTLLQISSRRWNATSLTDIWGGTHAMAVRFPVNRARRPPLLFPHKVVRRFVLTKRALHHPPPRLPRRSTPHLNAHFSYPQTHAYLAPKSFVPHRYVRLHIQILLLHTVISPKLNRPTTRLISYVLFCFDGLCLIRFPSPPRTRTNPFHYAWPPISHVLWNNSPVRNYSHHTQNSNPLICPYTHSHPQFDWHN